MSEWRVNFGDEEQSGTIINVEEWDEDGGLIHMLVLTPPSHAKLYYALKDWFND